MKFKYITGVFVKLHMLWMFIWMCLYQVIRHLKVKSEFDYIKSNLLGCVVIFQMLVVSAAVISSPRNGLELHLNLQAALELEAGEAAHVTDDLGWPTCNSKSQS